MALLLAGCGVAGSDSSGASAPEREQDALAADDRDDASTTTSDDESGSEVEAQSEPPSLTFIPESMVEDLADLQWAIDIKHNTDTMQCLREQGYDVRPSDPNTLRDVFDPPSDPLFVAIKVSLGDIDPRSLAPADPNEEYLASLSEDELRTFSSARDSCFLNSDWNQSHPLADEGTLFNEASIAASDLVASDPSFIDSRSKADRCVSKLGYGSRSDVHNGIFTEVDELNAALSRGSLDVEQVRARVEELETFQAETNAAFDDCFNENQQLALRLYVQYLNDYVDENPAVQIEILELTEFIDKYRAELSTIEALE